MFLSLLTKATQDPFWYSVQKGSFAVTTPGTSTVQYSFMRNDPVLVESNVVTIVTKE